MLDALAPFAPIALSWMLRGSAILAIALLVVPLLGRLSASLRHAVLTAAVIAALIAPPFSTLELITVFPADVATWLSAATPETLPNVTLAPTRPAAQLHAPRSPLGAPGFSMPSPLGIATFVWLSGALLLVTRILCGLFAVRQVRRRSRVVTDDKVLGLTKALASHPPEIRISERLTAPATLGLWRATILLPPDASTWETERLRAVLAHELAHVARRDCLTSLLAHLACAFYWCNPLVWLVARRMVLEREKACDDRALECAEPVQYSLLLLDIARAAFRRPARPALLAPAVISMAQPSELESRLLAIVRGDDVARGKVTRRGLAVIVLCSVLLGTAAASHAAQPPRHRGEPDLRGDSIAPWTSERVPLPSLTGLEARVRASALWHGPDSAIVREFVRHVGQTADPEELYRERAAWALTIARGDRLLEPVLAALGSENWRVKAYAAWTLGYARERRAVPSLIELLEHSVWRMRAMAASALLQIGDPTALSAMIKALEDEAWQVRTPAVSYVAAHADPSTARRLLEPRLNDRHIAVRRAASQALVPRP